MQDGGLPLLSLKVVVVYEKKKYVKNENGDSYVCAMKSQLNKNADCVPMFQETLFYRVFLLNFIF